MSTFEKYFNKTEEEVTAERKNIIKGKVERGFASSISQVEENKLDCTEAIEKFRVAIANGDVNKIANLGEALVDLTDLDAVIIALREEEKEFLG